MINKIINIGVHTKGLKTEPCAFLTTYISDKKIIGDKKRRAILVCPGGGYRFCSNSESENIALRFVADGFAAFVLKYSVVPSVYPQALCEAAEAVRIIRKNAEEWNIDTEHIIVLGFSAGGHLAASLGVFYNSQTVLDNLKCQKDECRVNGMILCYPVITADEDYAHIGSFKNLLGESFTSENAKKLSVENFVTEDTPPAFIWHTFDDASVPVENSLMLFSKLRQNKIRSELHIFPHGAHGLSLADGITVPKSESVRPWAELASKWANNL